MDLDAAIFGGGAAGLWLLAELTHRGYAALLLEAHEIGAGQTIASQGILHGGLKYTLQGLLTPAAREIRELPRVWRDCLAGRRLPDLSRTRVRAGFCHLWRTQSLSSQLGMIGARFGLQVQPESIAAGERPDVLKNVPGTVARLDEQVISPASFLADLREQFLDRLVRFDATQGPRWDFAADGSITGVTLRGSHGEQLRISPRQAIFAAGAGNATLRESLGWSAPVMQRRPLHMVLVRGSLPELNGHCVDGARTRVTITSDRDIAGRIIWQVGGQVSEDGVRMSSEELIGHARSELAAVLPGVSFDHCEWATYRIDRAEGAMPHGRRPDSVQIVREQNVWTVWPTKLVLVPHLAETLISQLPPPSVREFDQRPVRDWPRPLVAAPPWETAFGVRR